MTHELFAVDPGKHHCAIAFFLDANLQDLTLVRADGPLNVAQQAAQWILGRCINDKVGPNVLCTEMQECYPAASSKINNDLFPLTFCVGAIHALVYAPTRLQPLPRAWKGSTPKAIFTNRIIAAATPEEVAAVEEIKCPKDMKHNLWDAIGLGKWALKQNVN